MLRSSEPQRAGLLKVKPAARPLSNRATSSRCSSVAFSLRLPLLLAAVLTVAASHDTAAPGPLHIIGNDNGGCIAGAVRLPAESTGFQTIHPARSSFWGAPATIAGIEK